MNIKEKKCSQCNCANLTMLKTEVSKIPESAPGQHDTITFWPTPHPSTRFWDYLTQWSAIRFDCFIIPETSLWEFWGTNNNIQYPPPRLNTSVLSFNTSAWHRTLYNKRRRCLQANTAVLENWQRVHKISQGSRLHIEDLVTWTESCDGWVSYET